MRAVIYKCLLSLVKSGICGDLDVRQFRSEQKVKGSLNLSSISPSKFLQRPGSMVPVVLKVMQLLRFQKRTAADPVFLLQLCAIPEKGHGKLN